MWIMLVALACTPSPPTDTGVPGGVEHDPIPWLHDYWTPTAEICQPPDPFVYPYLWDLFYADPCRQALADDLKIDEQSFSDDGCANCMNGLLTGAFYLLGRDMGTVEQLHQLTDETDLWAVRQPFIDQIDAAAEALGEDRAGPVLYNIVMSTILRTVYWDDAPEAAAAYFGRDTRTLHFWAAGDAVNTGTVLAHEAAHGWLDRWHVACPDGAMVDDIDLTGSHGCDRDWEGAYAFGAAAARLMHNGVPENAPEGDGWRNKADDAMEWQAAFIFEE